MNIDNYKNFTTHFLLYSILLSLMSFYLPACFAETIDKSQIIETIKYDSKRGLFYRTLPLTMQLDKDIALAAIKAYPYVLEHFHKSLKVDKDIAMAAVNIDGKTIQYLDKTLINDPEVALAAMTTNGSALKYLNDSNRSNKKIVMAAANQYSMGFRFASSALRDDKDIVLTAVRNNGQNLQYASARLRKDRDVVMAAVRKTGYSIKFAHKSMHKDKDIVLTALENNSMVLRYIKNKKFLNDKDIILAAVNNSRVGRVFEYAGFDIMKNKEDVLYILRNAKKSSPGKDGVLKYVHRDLFRDKDFIKKAIQYSPNSISSINFDGDKEVAILAIKQDRYRSSVYEKLSKALKTDRDVARAAVEKYGYSFANFPDELKKDKELALIAIKQHPGVLRYADNALKTSRKFVIDALAVNTKILKEVYPSLLDDKEVILAALKQDDYISLFTELDNHDKDVMLAAIKHKKLLYLLESSKLNSDKQFMVSAIRKNGLSLEYAVNDFKKDKSIVLEAVKQNGLALAYADKLLTSNRDIVLEAVKQNGLALAYADKMLLDEQSIINAAIANNVKANLYASPVLNRALADKIEQDSTFVLNRYSSPAAMTVSVDSQSIYTYKKGVISQYRLNPLEHIRSVEVDVYNSQEKKYPFRIYVSKNEKFIIAHSRNQMLLLNLAQSKIEKTVHFNSELATLNKDEFVTIGNDNIMTIWDVATLTKKRTIKSAHKWSGKATVPDSEYGKNTFKYSVDWRTSNLISLKNHILLFRTAMRSSHSAYPGEVTLFDAGNYDVQTTISHYNQKGSFLSYDKTYLYIEYVKNIKPAVDFYRLSSVSGRTFLKYEISTGKTEPINNESKAVLAKNNIRLSFKAVSVPSNEEFYISGRNFFNYRNSNHKKIFNIFSDRTAILMRHKGKAFQATSPDTYKHIRMRIDKGEKIPINMRLYNENFTNVTHHYDW